MNTTANIQVFPTPYAFKKPEHKTFMDQNLSSLLNCDKIISKDRLLLDKLKRKLIQNALNVKIETSIPLDSIDIKQFFKFISANINSGKIKIDLIKQYLQNNLSEQIVL